MDLNSNIEKAKQVLKYADGIIITAGAGMGVDSGLPDFRGDEGFWKAYPPLKKLGISFVDMANPRWFKTDPTLAWGFYGHRLNLYRNTKPHKGFELLKEFVKTKNNNYFIFTSNVDGQFQKAGFDEDKIVEVHGSIHFNQCIDCCTNEIWSNQELNIDVDEVSFRAKEPLAKCKNCKSIARPNILMFGDFSFISNRVDKQEYNLDKFLNNNKNKSLAIIEIGAGEAVPTVRYFGESIQNRYNATLIRINPRDFSVPFGAISIPLGGYDGIKAIL